MGSPDSFEISAEEAVRLSLAAQRISERTDCALIDVRSEGEFADSGIAGWNNFPILNNEQRHQVGIRYKNNGQEAAIQLGLKLVETTQTQSVEAWKIWTENSNSKTAVLSCWRGGLRSQTAAQWLKSELNTNAKVKVVKGGYKAMRQVLLKALQNCPEAWVLTGLTGSGKTRLLKELPQGLSVIDLEDLAKHRGSSFGKLWNAPQPAQAVFENLLALKIHELGSRKILFEDESRNVGVRVVPHPVFTQMRLAPLVFLDAPIEDRIRQSFEDFVLQPYREGLNLVDLQKLLLDSVGRLEQSLGVKSVQEISSWIKAACQESPDTPGALDKHGGWISRLLESYYDPKYKKSLKKSARTITFKGTFAECKEYLLANLRVEAQA